MGALSTHSNELAAMHRTQQHAQVTGAHAGSGALVVGLHHVLGEALKQRRARAGGADAARTALDAQVLQHQRLQLVADLRHRLGGLRAANAVQICC